MTNFRLIILGLMPETKPRNRNPQEFGKDKTRHEKMCDLFIQRVILDDDFQATMKDPRTHDVAAERLNKFLKELGIQKATELAVVLLRIIGRESVGGIPIAQTQFETANTVFSQINLEFIDFGETYLAYLSEVAHQSPATMPQIEALLERGVQLAPNIPASSSPELSHRDGLKTVWGNVRSKKGFSRNERKLITAKLNEAQRLMPKRPIQQGLEE